MSTKRPFNFFRFLFHLIIGTAFGHCLTINVWQNGWLPKKMHLETGGFWEFFGASMDYLGGYIAPFAFAAFWAGFINFWIEDGQLRFKKTMLGFSYRTILLSLLSGFPAGILFLAVNDDRYDHISTWIDLAAILILAAYYFIDYHLRNRDKNPK